MRKQRHQEYRGFRNAGIRLTEELLPDIVTHLSAQVEVAKLPYYHVFDKAHLVMLSEERIIPPRDAAAMLAALREMEAKGVEQVRLAAGGGMHSGEQYLIRKLSEEVGGRIHVGRSSGDLDRVGARLRLRDRLLDVMEAVNRFRLVLLETAGRHADVVMPGYTHGEHAQPTTLGHQLLAWAVALSRDFQRLAATFQRTNTSPAGAAIMTGSSFPVNRYRTAELLGFDRPCENTMDAVLSADDLLEAFSTVAVLHTNVAIWADDVVVWSRPEVGMVEIPDRFCGTSSILAQKKNPYALEHTRGAASETIGGMMTAFGAERGPTGLAVYSRAYYSSPALHRSIDNVLRDLKWLAELVPALRVNRELMRERAGAYWAQATDVAGALVQEKGLPWRTAHQIVGILVRLSGERGIAPRDVDTSLLDEAAVEYMGEPVGLSDASLRRALDPVDFVARRTLYGGPAPEEVRRRTGDCVAALKQDEEWLAGCRARLREAADKLERAIDAIIRDHLSRPTIEETV